MEILFLEVSVTDTCHDAEIFPTEKPLRILLRTHESQKCPKLLQHQSHLCCGGHTLHHQEI